MAPTPEISPRIFFQQIVQELTAHPAIELVLLPEDSTASEGDFKNAHEQFGVAYSPAMKAFFKEVNGIQLSWKHEKVVRGELNILDIGAVTQGFYDNFWKKELKKDRTKDGRKFWEFVQDLNSLEVFDDTTDGTLRTVLHLQKNTPKPQAPQLWLWNLAGEKYPLAIDFDHYWPLLAKTRGFAGWPYFFIDLEKCAFEDPFFRKYYAQSPADAIPPMKQFLKLMPRLFPDDDFAMFETLYQQIQAAMP